VSNPATLSSLQSRALDFADMTSSGFAVTARLTDYINDGLSELHELLAMHEYLRSTQAIALVSGTEEYALPADFYKAMRVWRVSNGRRYSVEKFNLAQLDGYNTSGPAASGTAELWYVPQLTQLVQPGDSVSVALPNGWEGFVALHAAIQLLNREESDPNALMAERERVKQRIVAHVEPRDTGIPDEIEDHYGRWDGGIRDDEERTLRYRVMGNKIHFVEFDYLGV
jgi:hypothetical protein